MQKTMRGTEIIARAVEAGVNMVYSTDSEHKQQDEDEIAAVVDFYREADLVIFDAMYSLADMITIKEVRETLQAVRHPEYPASLLELRLGRRLSGMKSIGPGR